MKQVKVVVEEDDDIGVDEFLVSMASAMISSGSITTKKTNNYQVNHTLHKPKNDFTSKPSADILRRDLSLFTNKLPRVIPHRKCECLYKCQGAIATINCFSCGIYNQNGKAYYCQHCYDIRHPWYRIPHYYDTIENDEDILLDIQKSQQNAQLLRYEQERVDLLELTKNQYPTLAYIADDEVVEDKIRALGRRLLKTEKLVKDMQNTLQNHIQQENLQEQCRYIIRIQKIYRGYLCRRMISLKVANNTFIVHDEKDSNISIFYNKITKTFTQSPSKLLLRKDYSRLRHCIRDTENNLIFDDLYTQNHDSVTDHTEDYSDETSSKSSVSTSRSTYSDNSRKSIKNKKKKGIKHKKKKSIKK